MKSDKLSKYVNQPRDRTFCEGDLASRTDV